MAGNTVPVFGTGGIVTTNIGPNDLGRAVTVLPDGHILVAGYANQNGYQDFTVVRYNADGSLDTSFGGGDGIVGTPVGPSDDVAFSIAVQPDGAILVVGASFNGFNYDIAVTRYNADGSLDASFGGGDGIVVTPVGPWYDYGIGVVVLANGDIIVTGFASNGANEDIALLRFNADGTLDTDFGGGDGIVTTPIGPNNDQGMSVIALSDGNILVAGSALVGSGYDFALVRYNADGSLDTSFGGGDGIVTTALVTGTDQGYAMALQPDGAILVAGQANNGSNADFALVRYNADGTLDTTFGGGDGIVLTPISLSHDIARGIVIQPDGKILVAGYANVINPDFAVVRYNADGSLDTTFGGGDGIVTFPVGTADDVGFAIALQPDGTIVVAGTSYSPTGSDIALALLNPDGSFKPTVNTLGGTVTYVENGSPPILDSDVVVHDAELDALNGGAGDYAGATLTLARTGGADAQDLFIILDHLASTFTRSGNNLQAGGLTFATVSGYSGTLTISFTSAETPATTSLVQDVLHLIAYANMSDAPPSSVEITWLLSDGDPTDPLTATGTTTVNIVAENDAPTAILLSTSSVDEMASDDSIVGVLSATDPDGGTPTFTLLNDAGGRFWLDGDTIKVADGLLLDFEQSSSHVIRVRVDDGAGGVIERDLIITVGNVDPESATAGSAGYTLVGGGLDDSFAGGAGVDEFHGGDGDDTLNGSAGPDRLYGDAGSDTFDLLASHLAAGAIIDGGADDDVLNINGDGAASLVGVTLSEVESINLLGLSGISLTLADASQSVLVKQASGLADELKLGAWETDIAEVARLIGVGVEKLKWSDGPGAATAGWAMSAGISSGGFLVTWLDTGSASWVVRTASYSSSGVVQELSVQYDDGVAYSALFSGGTINAGFFVDHMDAHGWTSIIVNYNASGVVSSRETTMDSGQIVELTYASGEIIREVRIDGANTQGWDRIEKDFVGGEMVSQIVQYDNGIEVSTAYSGGVRVSESRADQGDLYAWNSIVSQYDSGGASVLRTTTYDSGVIVAVGFAGTQILAGGAFNDTLTGGADADTFVFRPMGGRDRVTDFANGQDLLDLTAFGIDTLAGLQAIATLSDTALGLRIDFGGGQWLTVTGLDVANLDDSDFAVLSIV